MKTGMLTAIALATLFGIALVDRAAQATEPVSGAEDELMLSTEGDDGLVALDSEEMAEANGGFVVQQSSTTNQNSEFSNNGITVTNGSQISTGNILANSANTGGMSPAVGIR